MWLLEADAQMAQLPLASGAATGGRVLIAKTDLAFMSSKADVCWPGYRRVHRGSFYEKSYSFPYHVVGSHAISFKGSGCCSLQTCLMNSPRYCHLDALLSRGLASYYLPSLPCIGTRSNKNALHDSEKEEARYCKASFLMRHRFQSSIM